MQQRQGVSKFLVQGAHQTVEKENIPTKRNDPVNPLLLLDGHSTHYNSFIRQAAQEKVVVFCLPPNTTHLTQPLDKGALAL